METTQKAVPVVVYAEATPNPSTLKLVANKLLVAEGVHAEFLSIAETSISPLAKELFNFPFVKSVFISSNYIAITKRDVVAWEDITLELREFVRGYLAAGKAVLTGTPEVKVEQAKQLAVAPADLPKNELEQKIVEVLDQYIRPAVEQDGGLIVFKSFNEGVVTVQMKGACSGCPSSTMTLKAGIEALLKRLIPQVKEVISEAA